MRQQVFAMNPAWPDQKFAAGFRLTILKASESLLCSDKVIRYRIEPPFNDQPPHESRYAE